MEDVSLWRFNPCVVHGDLHEDNLLVDGDRVTAVTGWTDLRIGDPADDMAWLVASNEQAFVDAVLEHYTASPEGTRRTSICCAVRHCPPNSPWHSTWSRAWPPATQRHDRTRPKACSKH